MKYYRPLVLVFSGLLIVLNPIVSGQASNLTGTWTGYTEIPGQGRDELTLTLDQKGLTVTGSLSDSLGTLGQDTELRNVVFEADSLSFFFWLLDGTEVKMVLTVKGGTMSGQWELPEGDVGSVEFEKKK